MSINKVLLEHSPANSFTSSLRLLTAELSSCNRETTWPASLIFTP